MRTFEREQLVQILPCNEARKISVEDLYMRQELRRLGSVRKPFIYSNFIVSLDGRVSVPKTDTGIQSVPAANTNANDIALFKQLLAHADAVITSGRHLRALANAHETNLASLDAAKESDLIEWRRSQGLAAQPELIVLSKSLRLPERQALPFEQTPISVVTWSTSDAQLNQALREKGYRLFTGAASQFGPQDLLACLRELRYTSVYSIAGPSIFSQLLHYGLLDRLYLTITQQFLGGEQIKTLTSGGLFEDPKRFSLQELYFDPSQPDGAGQFFCVFDAVKG